MSRALAAIAAVLMLAASLPPPASAADPNLPADFDLSGIWAMPGPAITRIERSGPGWYQAFWNHDVMAGRDRLTLEPVDPYCTVDTEAGAIVLSYLATFHHAHGWVNDYEDTGKGTLCEVTQVDYQGPATLTYSLASGHHELEAWSLLPLSIPPVQFPRGMALESGVEAFDDCDVRYLFRDPDGAAINLGMTSGTNDAQAPRPPCQTECEEPDRAMFLGGGYIICNSLSMRRFPGAPADLRGWISGAVRIRGMNNPVDLGQVRLVQQAGPLPPAPAGVNSRDHVEAHRALHEACVALGPDGSFVFEDVPLMTTRIAGDGSRTETVGAHYALFVEEPRTSSSGEGMLYHQGTHLLNVEPNGAFVELLVDPLLAMGRKQRDIDRLSEIASTNYAPWERGPGAPLTAQAYLDALREPGHEVTDVEREAVDRAAWAEDVVWIGADYSKDLIEKGMKGLATIIGVLMEDIDLDGAEVGVAKRWKDAELEPDDWELIQRTYGADPSCKGNVKAIAGRLDQVAARCEALEVIGDLMGITKSLMLKISGQLLPDATQEELETAMELTEKAANVILGFLATRAMGHGGAGGLMPLLQELVEKVAEGAAPLLFDEIVETWFGDFVVPGLPSYTGMTQDELQFSVEQLHSWASYDPAACEAAVDHAFAVIGDLNQWGTWTVQGWIWATEFVSDTFGTAADVFSYGGKVIKQFKVAERVSKVLQYGGDGFSFAAPMVYAFVYAPRRVREGVYAAFGQVPPPLPPREASRLRPQPALAAGAAPKNLTSGEITTAAQAAALALYELAAAIEEGRLGDAMRSLDSGAARVGLDACEEVCLKARRLLAALVTLPDHGLANQGSDELRDLERLARVLRAERRAFEERLLDLFGKVLSGGYGEGGPRYEADRARAAAAAYALYERTRLLPNDLQGVAALWYSRFGSLPAVVQVDLLELRSEATGESAVTASPEEFLIRLRARNLGGAAAGGVSLVLTPLPADGVELLTPAELAPPGGSLAADDDAAGGADEAELSFRVRSTGALDVQRPRLLRVEVREAGGRPASFLGYGLDLRLALDQRVFDADLDGMPDAMEVAKGLDPTVDDAFLDLDGDGLPNRFEFRRGTDPAVADSDGDGLADGEEEQGGADGYRTDPLLADTDGDGVDDGADLSPLDPTSQAAGVVPDDPVVAVDRGEVVLSPDQTLVPVVVTNAGGGYLRFTLLLEDDALARVVGPLAPSVKGAPAVVLVQAPARLELSRAHGLETTLWVVDAAGVTHDQQPVRIRIEAPPLPDDGGEDGGADGGGDGGGDESADGGADDLADGGTDGASDQGRGGGGCGCGSTHGSSGGLLLLIGLALVWRRRG